VAGKRTFPPSCGAPRGQPTVGSFVATGGTADSGVHPHLLKVGPGFALRPSGATHPQQPRGRLVLEVEAVKSGGDLVAAAVHHGRAFQEDAPREGVAAVISDSHSMRIREDPAGRRRLRSSPRPLGSPGAQAAASWRTAAQFAECVSRRIGSRNAICLWRGVTPLSPMDAAPCLPLCRHVERGRFPVGHCLGRAVRESPVLYVPPAAALLRRWASAGAVQRWWTP